MSVWAKHVLPRLVEVACRGEAIAEERARLVPRAHGDVLEIGIGSGLNLAHYDPRRVRSLAGIDPSRELLDRALERAKATDVRVDLVEATAEKLPFGDSTFDSAVVTYSLCSVDDPDRALAEVRRVLRPGAELFFLEHGLARDPSTQAWQRRLTPAWSFVGGGCHLDRDVERELLGAELDVVELKAEHGDGAKWLSFTYEGVARKPT